MKPMDQITLLCFRLWPQGSVTLTPTLSAAPTLRGFSLWCWAMRELESWKASERESPSFSQVSLTDSGLLLGLEVLKPKILFLSSRGHCHTTVHPTVWRM